MAHRVQNRTLEMYKKVGAEARLLKEIFHHFDVDGSNISPDTISGKLFTIDKKLSQLISDMEDLMFHDFPRQLDNDYTHVFYGSLDPMYKSRSEVDREIRDISKNLLKEWFGVLLEE